MTIDKIVKGVNDALAGELLTYNELLPYLDSVIDDINADLDSTFPVLSDFTFENYPEHYPNYDFFPEKYIRSVLIKGAAYKFYVADEDGIPTAQQYQSQYIDDKFRMQRDYIEKVPEEFQADSGACVHDLCDVAWKDPWLGGTQL